MHLLHKSISGNLHMATHVPGLMALFLQLQSQQQQVELSHHFTLASKEIYILIPGTCGSIILNGDGKLVCQLELRFLMS